MSEDVENPQADIEGAQQLLLSIEDNEKLKKTQKELDKIQGQYKSLQTKHNELLNISKESQSETDIKMKQMQDNLDKLNSENTAIKKASLLTELQLINPKLIELHKDSSVEQLSVAIVTAKAMTSELPIHSQQTPQDQTVGIGEFNPATGKYE